MTLNWDDSLKTGIKEIDEQHKELFGLFNEIRAIPISKDKEKLKELIQALRNYSLKHFAAEEYYMKTFGYEHYEYHKFLHEKINEEFEKVAAKLLTDEHLMAILPTIVSFVEIWIQDHYKIADIKMAQFLRSKIKKEPKNTK